MSARKRVPIPIRPEPGADLPAAERTAVLEAVNQNRALEGSLLPILHAIQDRLGWIPPRTLPLIAFELNLTRAEVCRVPGSAAHARPRDSPGPWIG